ncbi:S-layer homology domain-containing protein [Acidaminococcus sp. NSJ-142]|jgi:hypothetical protein|uniref:S-layer homology domain-containing protein n=1 Tax=Acidaminococcus TaxID=904 RepID=UPI000CF9684C|nr:MULTISPECIES: S-layer homology domain-containing protein [Acidaminococcus]MCD2435181.1 S-layer homology domain-containing protein [Acidaminococcus hominis]MCH4097219.1 S-layer homology domain-containing protein [Acidaminococcus provencensis]RHK02119.1 hypothetical protein DW089_05285 [Acidaminococcus sp. AM05-11]
MKKSLVFAMAMALGVSATAFAANPFSDVPAGSWAYGAVAKLAAAGIVDGYPDGTFKGERTMTRYEMAQIVAKALAKGAIGADDRLVSEFADELDNLGVRVAKLERNADNVKITGNVRLSNVHTTGDYGKSDATKLRTRLFFTGDVNDNWNYVAMIENNQVFDGQNESGNDDTDFQRAYLTGNIGVVNVTAGRYDTYYSDGNVYDDRVDAVNAKVKFGQTYLAATYGKMGNASTYSWSTDGTRQGVGDKFVQATLGGDIGKLNLEAAYLKADDINTTWMTGDDKIWTAAANYNFGDASLGAMYLKGDNDSVDKANGDDDGYVISLNYKGAEAAKPGTWGLFAKYYDQGGATYIAHTMDGAYDVFDANGFKGYQVGGNLTLAKNMVAQVEYYDLKSKGGTYDGQHARTLWSQMVVTF